MFDSACAAVVRMDSEGPWVNAIAILKDPGIYDVKLFIRCDTGETFDTCYNYILQPFCGCFTILKDRN